MRFALLRVSRPDWDAEVFVREHGLTTAPFWRAAGLVADGTRTRSGFNLAIAGPEQQSTAGTPIGEWLRQNRSVLEAIGRMGAIAELHIGLGVEEREPFTQATFTSTELALLAECGIQLKLTAFEQTGKG